MAVQPRLPPKKQVALALLEQASVFVHLDPRGDGVHVPEWFKKQPQLVLQIGLNMAVPIRDLDVTDDGISCTLSFNRSPHFCRLPWRSVFALVGEAGRGMVWPEDVPAEVVAQAEAQKARPAAKEEPKLYAVGRAEPAPADINAGAPAEGAEPRARKPRKPRAKRAPAPVERGAVGGRREPTERGAEASPRELAEQSAQAGRRERKEARSARAARGAVPKAVERSAEGGRRELTERSAEGGRRELIERSAEAARREHAAEGGRREPAAPSKGKRALPPYLRVIK